MSFRSRTACFKNAEMRSLTRWGSERGGVRVMLSITVIHDVIWKPWAAREKFKCMHHALGSSFRWNDFSRKDNAQPSSIPVDGCVFTSAP